MHFMWIKNAEDLSFWSSSAVYQLAGHGRDESENVCTSEAEDSPGACLPADRSYWHSPGASKALLLSMGLHSQG